MARQYGIKKEVLFGMSYGTHWELGKHLELMGPQWQTLK